MMVGLHFQAAIGYQVPCESCFKNKRILKTQVFILGAGVFCLAPAPCFGEALSKVVLCGKWIVIKRAGVRGSLQAADKTQLLREKDL